VVKSQNEAQFETSSGKDAQTDEFLIREGALADASAIASIHVRAWQSAYRGQMPDALLDSRSVEDREERWRRAFARRAAGEPFPRIWVAERDGHVIGFASGGPSQDDDAAPETGEIYTVYLEPEVVGTGVGRELFARAVQDLRRVGFERATLWVLTSNAPTRRFYEAAGWHFDGAEKIEDWDGHGIHEVRYQIDLAT
jgi:L-amino acid N-acyltransferase YncA